MFQICGLLSLLLLGIAIIVVSVTRAGANLHHDALRTLIKAPLSFFTGTDTGVVTNLFSQDLNLIDTELPNGLLNTLFSVSFQWNCYSSESSQKQIVSTDTNSQIFSALGQAAVMLTSSPYMAISYPFLAALLYVVQRFYLRTSRQLRLLDLEAKSPL